jgi:sulfate transport system substrate-binding protein
MTRSATLVLAAALLCLAAAPAGAEDKLPSAILNVSYDVSRELFTQINPAFIAKWTGTGHPAVEIKQSHGGSSKQARSVLEGLAADVVTLNQVPDVKMLADGGVVRADWQKALPNNASPFYSLPVLLVRKGNPKNVRDWSDLARPDVQPVFPNPKTSGNGRYTYLAAYAWALDANKGDDAKARAFIHRVLGNVPVFDTGGRGATITFVEREIGDVLITFEAEIAGIRKEYGDDKFEAVFPSLSLQADFPVAIVDKVVDRRGSRPIAEAYLQFLYSDEAQEILARNRYRVQSPAVTARHEAEFPKLKLVTVEQTFGGWDTVNKVHFAEGGVLDQLMK